MQITQAQLLRAVPELNKKALDSFVASANQFAIPFGIDTPARVAMYLAEVFHESGYLKGTSENMNYSAQRLMQVWPSRFKTLEVANQYAHNPEKLANNVYANRMGNGNEASGDGWRFRGRGFIGLTGKAMYAEFNKSDMCTEDVLKNPDKVADFPLDQVSAMWFWEKHNLNKYADKYDIDGCSRAINGGTLGLANRAFLYRRFCKEFGVKKI